MDATTNERFTVDIYNSSSTVSLGQLVVLGSQDPADASFANLVLSKGDLSDYGAAGNSPRFDEFRFGTTLADVSLIPEPGSLALASLGMLGLLARRKRA